MASDEPESAAIVEKHMPATVQLIALSEIWKASVPDQKKASLLLSEVTTLLQKLSEKSEPIMPADAFSDQLATAVELLVAHGHRSGRRMGLQSASHSGVRGFDSGAATVSSYMT